MPDKDKKKNHLRATEDDKFIGSRSTRQSELLNNRPIRAGSVITRERARQDHE